jgi:BirA family transcriptional regulator, biotin operon repressor / biotin---[acetyl-CoA-carboxylase] ligase
LPRHKRLSANPVWPAGVGRHLLDEVDSTLDEAARRAPHLTGPEWLLAGFQTGGRGRRGRAWVSPRGNFHATLVMRPPGGPAQAALRSFVAALALHKALSQLTATPQALALKWPNDVLLNGGKVSGILLESLGQGGRLDHLAIGIGVNLIAAPDTATLEPDARHPVSVLGEIGLRIAPETLLDHLAPAFADWETRLQTQGFAPIRDAWLARAAHLGQPIRARTGTTTHHGTFETLDKDGALVLNATQGRLTLPAADIFF